MASNKWQISCSPLCPALPLPSPVEDSIIFYQQKSGTLKFGDYGTVVKKTCPRDSNRFVPIFSSGPGLERLCLDFCNLTPAGTCCYSPISQPASHFNLAKKELCADLHQIYAVVQKIGDQHWKLRGMLSNIQPTIKTTTPKRNSLSACGFLRLGQIHQSAKVVDWEFFEIHVSLWIGIVDTHAKHHSYVSSETGVEMIKTGMGLAHQTYLKPAIVGSLIVASITLVCLIPIH